MQQVKKATITVDDKLYTNLDLFIQVSLPVKDHKSFLILVKQEKLQNGDRQKKAAAWLDLVRCLLQFKEQDQARKAYDRALLTVVNEEKTELVTKYAQLTA